MGYWTVKVRILTHPNLFLSPPSDNQLQACLLQLVICMVIFHRSAIGSLAESIISLQTSQQTTPTAMSSDKKPAPMLAGTLQTDPRSGGLKRSSGVNVLPIVAESKSGSSLLCDTIVMSITQAGYNDAYFTVYD
jgi:hypothetical protein